MAPIASPTVTASPPRPRPTAAVVDSRLPLRRDRDEPHERWAAATLGVTVAAGFLVILLLVANNPDSAAVAKNSVPGTAVRADKDLRFASLGDISTKLKELRRTKLHYPVFRSQQLPVKYRLQARKYSHLVQHAARQYRLPPSMLYAMIETESSFNPSARSGSKAVGLMQLTPQGGAQVAYRFVEDLETIPTIEQLLDPGTNIQLGAAYMRVLLDDYFDDIPREEVRRAVALAAYNWGPTRVRAVLRVEGIPDSVGELQKMLHKHAAPVETRNYIRIITQRMDTYS